MTRAVSALRVNHDKDLMDATVTNSDVRAASFTPRRTICSGISRLARGLRQTIYALWITSEATIGQPLYSHRRQQTQILRICGTSRSTGRTTFLSLRDPQLCLSITTVATLRAQRERLTFWMVTRRAGATNGRAYPAKHHFRKVGRRMTSWTTCPILRLIPILFLTCKEVAALQRSGFGSGVRIRVIINSGWDDIVTAHPY